MRPAPAALAAATAAALLAAGGAAAAVEEGAECPPAARPPRVEVSLDDPEPTLDLGAGMEDLRAEADAPGGATLRHLGATVSRVHWHSEIEARVQSSPGGGVCARPDRVSLGFRHAEHGVRIARELPRGGCLFRETEAHERRHVAANRATLRRAASGAEAAARNWAASAVGRGATERAAMAALRDGLRRAVAPTIGAMQAARDAAHREIDGPEEYRRLGRVCPDDQRTIREPRYGG